MKKLILILALGYFHLSLFSQNTFPTTGRVGIGTISPSAWLTLRPLDANAIELRPFGTSTGNTSEFRLLELASNGTNFTGFKAPNSLGTNNILVLPSTIGTSGQALVTNGSGVLSWSSFANTSLSNLSATTSINSTLRPTGVRSLGTSSNQWSMLYLSGNVYRGAQNFLQWNSTNNNVEIAGGRNTSGAFSSDNLSIGFNAGGGAGLNDGHANDICIGTNAGNGLTTGSNNVLIGPATGIILSTGGGNTIIGAQGATSLESGSDNTLLGAFIGGGMNNSAENVFIGRGAAGNVQDGSRNVVIGNFAGASGSVLAYAAEGNTLIGYQAATSGAWTNASALGNGAIVSASNRVRLGNNTIARISGQVGFSIDSDRRLKQNIQDYSLGLDFIKKLRPSSYEYINNIEGGKRQGFIAQEVESALNGIEFEGLSKPEHEKDFYALNYSAFVVPLVNAVKELSERLEKLEAENKLLKSNAIILKNNSIQNNHSIATIHPNPSNDFTNIKFTSNIESQISMFIYSFDGKLVRSEIIPASSSSFSISTRELTNGIYTLMLIADENLLECKQLVVNK
jgi:trimeric autotransporter adhesin